jgi:hypothetical protein
MGPRVWEVKAPRFRDIGRLSAIRTGRLCPQEYPGARRKLSMYVSVLTQPYSQNRGKSQLHVSALNGRAIIRLNIESHRKFMHYNVCYTSRTEGRRNLDLQ